MDLSLYEQGNPTRQGLIDGIAFGRITKVYPEDRMCEVKTFYGTGPKDDNHIPKAQWVNLDSNPNGDESGSIPRINSYCLVFYVAGEALVFGFFTPLDTTTGVASSGAAREQLNEGDRIISTVAGNKIILRAHGEIQIQSTNTNRTIYFPDSHLINTLCRNYEFRTDGGTVDWVNFDDANNTICREEFRDNIARNNVIIVERGLVGEFISRTEIGTGGDDGAENVVWTKTIKNTGETELFIRAPNQTAGHKYHILPDGTTTLDIAGKTTLKILPTGETTLDVGPGKATLNIKPSGDTTYTTKGAISMTTDKSLTATVKGGLTANVTGAATIKASGTATIDCATASIKAKSNSIKGGAVAAHVVNNDPITGIPLTPCGGVTLD